MSGFNLKMIASSDETDHAGLIKEQEKKEIDDTQAKIANLSRKGYQYLKKGQFTEAIDFFRNIIELDPSNHYALVGIGDTYRKKRCYQESIQYYQHCLKFYPDNNYALFGLADCYGNLKKFHQAIEIWEKYLKLDDHNITVLTRVADTYRKVKNLKRSETIYKQVLEIEPSNDYALIGLGHLHYDFKNFTVALDYWQKMYTLQGTKIDIRALTSIGNCYRKLKLFRDGTHYFEKALEREPANFYALFGLGDCHRGLNEPHISLKYWTKILQKDPQNKVILTRAGDAYRRQDKYDKAEEFYHQALNIEFDTYAVLGLATINKQRQCYNEAARSLEGLLKNGEQLYRVYPELMDCYIKLKDRHSAKLLWERFEKLKGVQSPIQQQMRELKQALGV